MTRRMLIDATHPEETRVVVVSGTRLEEFDVETSTKKQIKGNIYLAKVVRVEPSLQAAFVEYGGNRHGFLAFGEIHPDYYQIPVADRERLLAEQNAESEGGEGGEGSGRAEGDEEGAAPEVMGGDDGVEESERRRRLRPTRQYKIQEVIKRRQILLIQVVKEERGGKGAALTTYLSLAGRYCVLMPNSPRGGGVSRKITSANDRKRLKSIVGDLDIPEGMAVIVRTAGSQRSKAEIKRDYEYLLRTWDSVRELTLKSSAPALIYEEGNLIKRAIRDLYARDIDEVLVEGDDGYRAAKDFMRMLMPSHAKRVQPYKDPGIPLLQRFQIEGQLDAMHSPTVQLRSGGYIVINPTEALVSIDVNSGRSTRERNIEETALKTNLEAADELARQLRLRDMAGLIVIDFIDMDDKRNNHAVERRLKEALRHDRARIQIGKISAFGLLEMSRQRLRPSLVETSNLPCPHCGGTGHIRSVESTAIHVLRAIEEEGMRRRASEITVAVAGQVALYILNHKRAILADIEARYQFRVLMVADDSLIPPNHRIERTKTAPKPDEAGPVRPIQPETIQAADEADEAIEEAEEEDSEDEEEHGEQPRSEEAREGRERSEGGEESDGAKRKRRRRRRRRGGRERGEEGSTGPTRPVSAEGEAMAEGDRESEDREERTSHPRDDRERPEGSGEEGAHRRRRGRRGGRRRRRDGAPEEGGGERLTEGQPASQAPAYQAEDWPPQPLSPEGSSWVTAPAAEAPIAERQPDAMPKPRPEPTIHFHPEPGVPSMPAPEPPPAPVEPKAPSEPARPPRKGWWKRFTE